MKSVTILKTLKGLHHALPVKHLETSVAFYNKILGMEPTYSIEGHRTVGYKLFPGVYLNLVESRGLDKGSQPSANETPVLTLAVKDLDGVCETVKSAGGTLIGRREKLRYATKKKIIDIAKNLIALAE